MPPRPAFRLLVAALAPLLAGCEKSASGGRAECGLAAVAGPTTLLNEFTVPRQTLGVAPTKLPPRLVARLAAGPTYPAVVGRSDSTWIIGVEGALPSGVKAGFGVLVLDPSDRARGVMLFQGLPIEGAPRIGTVSIADTTVPLIGVQADPARFENPRCPFFPDSVLRRARPGSA
jgi:hypothetical protein